VKIGRLYLRASRARGRQLNKSGTNKSTNLALTLLVMSEQAVCKKNLGKIRKTPRGPRGKPKSRDYCTYY